MNIFQATKRNTTHDMLEIYIYIPRTQMGPLVLIEKGLVFGKLTFKNRGQLGSRGIYIYIYLYIYTFGPQVPMKNEGFLSPKNMGEITL